MIDLSRAECSKNYRASFTKATNTIIELMQQLQDSYNIIWEKLENQRKERAAIIEETIQLLKNNKVKLNKQLGRCDNHEINKELLQAINSIPDDEKETIQINLVRINNRYERICKLGKKLEELNNKLASFRILEADYEDEVEIVIPNKTKVDSKNVETPKTDAQESKIEVQESKVEVKDPKEQVGPKEEVASKDKTRKDDIEEVVSRKTASKELSDSLDQEIESRKRPDKSIKSTLIEDDDIRYTREDRLFDTYDLASIEDEINSITASDEDEESINQYLEAQSNSEDEEDEYVLFTINEVNTLKEIAKNVYQNESYWKYIYNYGHNKGKLDRKAAEYDVDIEEIASVPGYLRNVTLEFPTVLVTQEEIEQFDDNIVEFPSYSSRSRRGAA